MKVSYGTGNSDTYLQQIYRLFNTGQVAFRSRVSGEWSQYYYFSDDDTLLTSVQVDSLQTTNKTVVSAINEIGGNPTASTITDAYNRIKDELWTTWANGVVHYTFGVNGPEVCAIGYKTSDIYGSIILFSYIARRPACVQIYNGIWGSPICI